MDIDDRALAIALDGVLDLLAGTRGVDFRDYRRDTLQNRLVHRMEARGCADPEAYVCLLRASSEEVDRLVEAFLINVTAFRRDPAVFDALERHVLPGVAASLDPSEALRAWCVGAATGEEAYSVAMLLAGVCEARGAAYEVLGTDLNEDALEIARDALYPVEAAAELPAELRARWFVREGPSLRVAGALRSHVRFTRHDFLGLRIAPSEAVVADFHLVLLRNVLIYLDERLQRRSLERVAGVLRPGGVLVLGVAETMPSSLTAVAGPFETLDPDLRLFRRREGGSTWR